MNKAPESSRASESRTFLNKVIKRSRALKTCAQIMAFVGSALAAQGIAKAQGAALPDPINFPGPIGTNENYGAHINVNPLSPAGFSLTWYGKPSTGYTALEAEFVLEDNSAIGGVNLNLVSPVAPPSDLSETENVNTGEYIKTFREGDGRVMQRIRSTANGLIINGENRCPSGGGNLDSIDTSPTPGNLRLVYEHGFSGDPYDVPTATDVSDICSLTDAAHKVPQLSTVHSEIIVVCDQEGKVCAVTRDVSGTIGARIMVKSPVDGLLKHMRRNTSTTPVSWVLETQQTVAGGKDFNVVREVKELVTASGRHLRLMIMDDTAPTGDNIFRALVLELQPDGTLTEVPLTVTTASVLAYQDSDGDGVADRNDQCPGRAGEQLDIPYVCAADFGEGHFAPDQPADPNNVTPNGLRVGIPEIPEYARVLGGNNASFVWYTDANDLTVTPDESNFFPQPGKFAYAHTAALTSPLEPEGSVKNIFIPDGHAATLNILGTNRLDGTPGSVTVLHTPITAGDTFPPVTTFGVPTSEPFELPAGKGDVMMAEGTVVVGDIDEVFTVPTCPPVCEPQPDAGQPVPDAGTGGHDAGPGAPDGGTPHGDAGNPPEVDAGGNTGTDAGAKEDAGTPTDEDAGTPPTEDAGCHPTADAGGHDASTDPTDAATPTDEDAGADASGHHDTDAAGTPDAANPTTDAGKTDAGTLADANSPDVPTQHHDGNGETTPDANGDQDTVAADGAVIHHHRADEGDNQEGCDCSVSETNDAKFSPEAFGFFSLVMLAVRRRMRKTVVG